MSAQRTSRLRHCRHGRRTGSSHPRKKSHAAWPMPQDAWHQPDRVESATPRQQVQATQRDAARRRRVACCTVPASWLSPTPASTWRRRSAGVRPVAALRTPPLRQNYPEPEPNRSSPVRETHMRGPKTVDQALNRLINLAARRTAGLPAQWVLAAGTLAACSCQVPVRSW